ncbi:MAG: helix-turn-helix transcriptional regulator [Pseudomonadota bacterium]
MSTTLVESFGIAVRRQREAQGWSQELLAERADLNRSYVGEIERGRVIPSLVTIDKLAQALGLSPHLLLQLGEQVGQSRLAHGINLAAIAC